MKRLLITGAAGGIGSEMRTRLAHLADTLRLSDVVDIGARRDNEEIVTCDLGDFDAVMRLVEGCDGIVHLGGVALEDKFSKILNANLQGIYNLYEATRAHGHPRIIFASSNHTVGFHRQDQRLDASAPMKPDGWYGVSKCFGEMTASLYYDKFRQETAIVRIGSCYDKPKTHRMLSTWLSFGDLAALIERAFAVPRLGCPIIYGISDNDEAWWDNSLSAYLGWRPKDSSRQFRDEIDAEVERPAPNAPEAVFQGGPFTQDPIFSEDD